MALDYLCAGDIETSPLDPILDRRLIVPVCRCLDRVKLLPNELTLERRRPGPEAIALGWGGWNDLETFLDHYRGEATAAEAREREKVDWL